MDLSAFPALPALLAGSITLVSWAVSGALALLSVPIARLPGFRPSDATRNAYMRALVYVANLAVLIGLAWTQNVTITRAQVPALLTLVAANAVSAHLGYTGAKTLLATRAGSPSAPAFAGANDVKTDVEPASATA